MALRPLLPFTLTFLHSSILVFHSCLLVLHAPWQRGLLARPFNSSVNSSHISVSFSVSASSYCSRLILETMILVSLRATYNSVVTESAGQPVLRFHSSSFRALISTWFSSIVVT